MQQFITITVRNLKIYFRDKGAVFFSLLSMLIVICLMVFFLGNMNIESITRILGEFGNRDAAADEKNAELLILAWTCAGIISINAVTVTMAACSVMIKDKVSGKINSIYTAPVSRGKIVAGYITAAWIASVIVCMITLFITEVYSVSKGLNAFSLMTHIQLLGMIMVNSFIYAAFMYLVAILAKTEGAWSGLGTVIGTLVGFLGGIYIPIGALSDTIGNLMKCTPILYGTAMFRSVMTKEILTTTFSDIPPEIIAEYRSAMGIDLTVFDNVMSVRAEWLILLLCGIIFLAIGIITLAYGRKTDK